MQSTLCDYVFTNFSSELEKIPGHHPHVVRREPWTTLRDEFALNELISLNPELYNQLLQGWSRSYYDPSKHMEQILQYGTQDIPISAVDSTLFATSVESVKNRLHSLQSVRAYDVLSEMDRVSFKSSSAAGYDYQGAKGPINGENHKRAIKRAKAIIWSVVEERQQGLEQAINTAVPDVGYTRTQLTDLSDKLKVRGVWGRAFHYILLEGLFAEPLLNAFMSHHTFYHIGQDPTESVPRLLSDTAKECKWIYALDWKQFDSTVSRFEMNAAFDILRSLLIFPNSETADAFEVCKQLFIHKKIAAPDGSIYWAHKGIPSGSFFTSIVGSIVNRLRIEYLWNSILGHPPKVCFTQGDDSLVGDEQLLHPDKIGEAANKIGWFFNPDKTEYSTVPEMVTFLGRTYRGGLNIRDLKKCLRLLIYPEYPVESGRISAYRARSITNDAGNMSEILNRLADRLRRRYGVASSEEVPHYFRIYIHGM